MIDRRVLFNLLLVVLLITTASFGVSAQDQGTQRINTINLNSDGDAQWTIEIREPINNEDDVSNFQSYVDQVNSDQNNETTQQFRDQFTQVVNGANQTYDRDMKVESLSVDAEIVDTATGSYGVTTIQFTWTNYAKNNSDGSLSVGSILSDGYTISEGERLRIIPPESYQLKSEPSGATVTDKGVIEWSGPYAFSNLDIILAEDTTGEIPLVPVVGLVVIISIFIISGVLYKRRSDSSDSENSSDHWSQKDLQTDEEKLASLIEKNGGRIKQKNVSEEFNWSAAKVSRVTGKLEDEEIINKLTIGRENVLDLDDEDQNN